MFINDTSNFITFSLSDVAHYTTKTTILGKSINIRCSYNSRNKLRWITITDSNNMPLLTQTFLKNKKQCEFNFLANIYDLSFYVTLKQKDKNKIIPENYDYLNWSSYFDMFFVGCSQNLKDRLRVNGRTAYVGN
jgi:hypothetical protein